MNTIETIKNNPVYKQVLADSMGGVIYNVANRDKYDDAEIIALWESLSDGERSSADGIIKGAMRFLTVKE